MTPPTDPSGGDRLPDRIRLVVLFGGRSAEHDVSRVTASYVMRAVDTDRYDIRPVGITRDGSWVFAKDAAEALAHGQAALPERVDIDGPEIDPLPALARVDEDDIVVVLPLLHGPLGEDGTVQGMLELADVPYVGAGVLGSAVAMDKAMAKQVLAQAGIPMARHIAWQEQELDSAALDEAEAALGYPMFVKPANLGSSIGVSKAADRARLEEAIELALGYDEWIVVEEAVSGREIECSVLGNTEPRASLPGEVVPGAEFYDYEDKYQDGKAEIIVPADLPDDIVAEVQDLAIRTFRALRVEGMARVDFFYEEAGRGLLLNELNTIPGFTPISMYPKLWEASGLSYPDLIYELVRLAIERHRRRRRNTGMHPRTGLGT